MTVLPFRERSSDPLEAYRFTAQLTKDTRTRLYQIIPLGDGTAQSWVRINGQPHRAQMLYTPAQCGQVRAQFVREIADLETDGWQR